MKKRAGGALGEKRGEIDEAYRIINKRGILGVTWGKMFFRIMKQS